MPTITLWGKFVSKKTNVNWGGMKKGNYSKWQTILKDKLQSEKDFCDWLKDKFMQKAFLTIKIRIFGSSNSVKPLDIHDACSQIINEITDIIVPREKGKASPQTADRHFWQVKGEKYVLETNEKERVEIDIEELQAKI